MSVLVHSMIVIPVAALFVAAGMGMAVRKFRAKDDKQFRNLRLS